MYYADINSHFDCTHRCIPFRTAHKISPYFLDILGDVKRKQDEQTSGEKELSMADVVEHANVCSSNHNLREKGEMGSCTALVHRERTH